MLSITRLISTSLILSAVNLVLAAPATPISNDHALFQLPSSITRNATAPHPLKVPDDPSLFHIKDSPLYLVLGDFGYQMTDHDSRRILYVVLAPT